MRRFLAGLWSILTFPIRLVFSVLAFPFRMLSRFGTFLNTEPDEHPISDVLSELATDQDARQTMWDEVAALRSHLLRALIVLMIAIGISFFFAQDILHFLAAPVGGLDKLKAIEVTESIGVFMRVALFSGIALSIPYIAFELWLFAAPGLRPGERKTALIGIPVATIFFLSGVAFTFYLMLPTAIPFLTNFQGIRAELRPQSYFAFVTGLMFWIGLSFEFPLVIYVISAIGLIKPRLLAEQWRIAVVIIAIAAAAITPTVDPVNMGLVMLPMTMLYFASIGLSYLAYAGRQRSNRVPVAPLT